MTSYTLPKLKYAYDALEPYIDATTMKLHHDKHHQGYVTKLNAACQALVNVPECLEELMMNIEVYNDDIRNNGGGHYNHSFFWESLSSNGAKEPAGELKEAIVRNFGDKKELIKQFSKKAGALFGSGWTWLCVDLEGVFHIVNMPNQDNPLMYYATHPWWPVLGLDVWEHAYYLHYQNRRTEYIAAFWHIVDWTRVGMRYEAALASK